MMDQDTPTLAEAALLLKVALDDIVAGATHRPDYYTLEHAAEVAKFALNRWRALEDEREDSAWRRVETAPRDGTHILAANFTPGETGFGYFGGKTVPWRGVVHWWPERDEAAFYLSSGSVDLPMIVTHWMPLP